MMLVTLLLGAVHFAPGRGSSIQPLTGTETITVDGNYVPLPAGGHGFNTSPLGVSRTLLQRLRAQGYTMTIERAEAFAEPGSDEVAENVLPLKTQAGVPLSQRYLQMLETSDLSSGSAPIKSVKLGMNDVMMVPVTFGTQELWTSLDTGSADTWVIDAKLKCANTRRDSCKFGAPYSTKSPTFSALSDQVFSISYADNSHVTGYMGTESVTLGNITVEKQPIAIIDNAKFITDGVTSGLTGLGFPSITNAYPKNGTTLPVKPSNRPPHIRYNPLFTSMHVKGLVKPFFSIAVPRPNQGLGALGLGGLPGGSIKHTGVFARAPFEFLAISSAAPPKADAPPPEYRFYAVSASGFKIDGRSSPIETMKAQMVVDTGSTITMLPEPIVKAYYEAWTGEKPRKDWLTQQYLFTCGKAQPPKFGVTFGGQTIWFDARDVVLVASGNLCTGAIQPVPSSGVGSNALSILGVAFMKNVVAVFDVGAAEMRFANRV